MSLLKKVAKGALAKKVIAEARKPENQARAKEALAAVRSRTSGARTRR
jgi:hypothetical protein